MARRTPITIPTEFRDGEQRKYHNFCTSAWVAFEYGSELGLVPGGPLIFN